MTNLNITSNGNVFTYVVDCIRNTNIQEKTFEYIKSGDTILFKSELLRSENNWNYFDTNQTYFETPPINSSSILRLYFPQFSIETYNEKVKYALDVMMYISNKKVVLGSFLIDRFDTLAAPEVIKFQGQEYFECIDLEIVDPYDILYSDQFQYLRRELKNCDENEDNSDGTSLYISLHPIEYDSDIYIIDNNYNGSQNSILISNSLDDFLSYSINFNEENNKLEAKISFNNVYKNDIASYMNETYNLNGEITIKYVLGLSKLSPSIIERTTHDIYYSFTTDDIKTNIKCLVPSAKDPNRYILKELFDDWNLWEEGINIKSSAIIKVDGEEKIILHSNQIPLTQELYSKIKIENQIKINLDDMNVTNINVINKINIESSQYHTPENSKSNIILPVFYKVRELGNVIIHPEVNENICINLDAYKSKVDTFVLQIEGSKFIEIGTTGAGTIFKIIGSSLPQVVKSGTFYILSQDGDLIVTGKYTYEY